MEKMETHFEQIPKSEIEKMLSKRNTTAGQEIRETIADEKSSCEEDKTLSHLGAKI